MVEDVQSEEVTLSFKAAGAEGETVSLPLRADGSRLARLRDLFKNADGSKIAKVLDILTLVVGAVDAVKPAAVTDPAAPQAFTAAPADGGAETQTLALMTVSPHPRLEKVLELAKLGVKTLADPTAQAEAAQAVNTVSSILAALRSLTGK